MAELQLGFSGVTLDMDDIRDISALRILVDGPALRSAMEHGDLEQEARVLGSHHRLSRTPEWVDDTQQAMREEWSRAHADFPAALLSACPRPRLRDLAESLRETAELYRCWSGMVRGEYGRCDVACDHRNLMQAALDRDADRAVVLPEAHINTTTVLLEAFVEEHRPDLVT